ncbi:YicC/YloC family endoribonuclease [Neptunicoccus sediminis]|uniref:YicC/YloC family endoribonuclease n=1 Tax=Neptunicoccus sediminis TaxID=1892596 RepID=UPI001FDF1630|nr:YicC/YloC family endoribonuclease [Neptunicoccus sediminis]
MTAFASANGSSGAVSWAWEIRSVNGRGLDVRMRLADGFDGLEADARKQIAAICKRGTLTIALRVRRNTVARFAQLNPEGLQRALDAARTATQAANVETAPLDIAAILALPGVFGTAETEADPLGALNDPVKKDFETALTAFAQARASEGKALAEVLAQQIDRIDRLCAQAGEVLDRRRDHVAETMKQNLARVLGSTDAVDEQRLEQELALLAVKADVSEELDRLQAHVSAARDLLEQEGPVGRKFDFLTQEFNREANTLCSKANFTDLTGIGLDLKAVIDQMREQVQNVE